MEDKQLQQQMGTFMKQCSEFSENEESHEQMINRVNPASSNDEKSVEMIEIAGEQLGSGQYTFLDDDQQQSGNNRVNFGGLSKNTFGGGQRVNDIEPIDFSLIQSNQYRQDDQQIQFNINDIQNNQPSIKLNINDIDNDIDNRYYEVMKDQPRFIAEDLDSSSSDVSFTSRINEDPQLAFAHVRGRYRMSQLIGKSTIAAKQKQHLEESEQTPMSPMSRGRPSIKISLNQFETNLQGNTLLAALGKPTSLSKMIQLKFLQSFNQYNLTDEEEIQSLKDVFRNRLQFNKKLQSFKSSFSKEEQKRFQKPIIQLGDADSMLQLGENVMPNILVQEESDEENAPSWWEHKQHQINEAIKQSQDETQFCVHGQIKRFSKVSLGLFDNQSKFRYVIVWIVTSKHFDNLIIFLIGFNSILLGAKDYIDTENKTEINQWIIKMEPLFTYSFTIEFILKATAQGFFLGRNAYLTNPWNWLDITCVIASFLEEIPEMSNMQGLKTFRLFRPLKSLTTMPSMRLLIRTLFDSVTSLGSVMALALFFFMIFAILGVSIWDGSVYYRCYTTPWPVDGKWDLVPGTENEHICSAGIRDCKVGYCNSRYVAYDARPDHYGLPDDEKLLKQDSDMYALNYGLTNFDNIIYALITIFQCITMEGWTKIMNIYEDTSNRLFVVFYFISCIIINSFFLLNLTIAVMLMKYEELDKQNKNSDHDKQLRELGRAIPGLKCEPQLIEFLVEQHNIQIQGSTQKLMKQELSFIKQLLSKPKCIIDKSHKYYSYWIVQKCYNIIMNEYFDAFIIIIIIINTLCLAMDKYPNFDIVVLDILNVLNYVFTVIFTTETVLKIVGLGWKVFIKDNFNKFDLLIVIISIIELQMSGESDGPGIFSSMRGFRLMKIFKLFRSGDLKILLDSITFTLGTIGDYVILLMLFMYVFALLGMSIFAGKIRFDEDGKVDLLHGKPPRTNFDTLPWAIITIFEVMMGEGWNDIMYQAMRSMGEIFSVYYILLVIFGNIIMLNLFLAILLGNFDKARNFGQKKKVFEAFYEIMGEIDEFGNKKYNLNQSLDIILGDMSYYVKTKVLKWNQEMVDKLYEKGETDIGQDLVADKFAFIKDSPSALQVADVDPKKYSQSVTVSKSDFQKSQLALPAGPSTRSLSSSKTLLTVPGNGQNPNKKENKIEKQIEKERMYLQKQSIMLQIEEKKNKEDLENIQKLSSRGKKDKPRGNELTVIHEDQSVGAASSIHIKKPIVSKTLPKGHKENKHLKRYRELNYSHFLYPNQNILNILQKKNPSQLTSGLKMIRTNTMSRLLATKETQKLEMEELDKEDELSEKQKEKENNGNNGSKESKIGKVTGAERRNKFKNQPKTLSLVDIMRKEETEAPDASMNMNRSDLLHKLAISRTNTMKKREDSAPKRKDISGKSIVSFMQNPNGNKPKTSETMGSATDEFIDYDQKFGPKRKKVPKNKKDLLPFKHRVYQFMSNSSLFCFHKYGKTRKMCQLLTETPEILKGLKEAEDLERAENEEVNPTVTDSRELSESLSEGQQNEMNMSMSNLKNKRSDKKPKHPSKIFEDTVLFCIITSTLGLAIDNPLYNPDLMIVKIMFRIDIVFTLIFFMEAAIKIISKGLVHNNLKIVEPYYKSAWNQLDLFVVTVSMIDLSFIVMGIDMQQLQALKSFRSLRGLRPLRVISRNEGMRLVVNALLASLPSMTNVLLVCSLFILIFSIMGVSFFKGTFYHCVGDFSMDDIITKQDCLDRGGHWRNTNAHFDDVLSAMLNLFQMTTTEGWVDVMNSGIDSVGIDKEPKYNNNVPAVIYFAAFMVVGSQFVINLFVGVVIDNFNSIKEKEELGNLFVTEDQRKWIEIQKVGQGKKLRKKINDPEGIQIFFNWLVKHQNFEYTITFFIVLNTIFMAAKHYRMSQLLLDISEYANYVFAFVFNVEMILKLLGLKQEYFYYTWNIFDIIIVFTTDLSILLKILKLDASFSSFATVFRAFRIMRMFKLIRSSVSLRLILDTIINILPQISNVMSLIFLLFFIYAALGLNLFCQVGFQDKLNDKNNFQSFPNAMIMLMKFSTGEDWNAYMYELANDQHDSYECLDTQTWADVQANDKQYRGCGSFLAYPYFISFTIIVSMLIMNLSVAAVIEGLEQAKNENLGIVTADQIEQLLDIWVEYDPKATGWISLQELIFLLYELPQPLGKRGRRFDKDAQNRDNEGEGGKKMKQQDKYLFNMEKQIVIKKVDALDLLKDLKIKVHDDPEKQIHWVDVFKALIKRICKDKEIDIKLTHNLNQKIKKNWNKVGGRDNKIIKGDYTARQQQAGNIITKWFKDQQQMRKNHYRKKKGHKTEDGEKGNNNQTHTEQLKQQAATILKIINQEESEKSCDSSCAAYDYEVKNHYYWTQKGGDIIEKISESSIEVFKEQLACQTPAPIYQTRKASLVKQGTGLATIKEKEGFFGPEAVRYLENIEQLQQKFPKDRRTTEQKLKFIKKLTLSQKALSELTKIDNLAKDEVSEEDDENEMNNKQKFDIKNEQPNHTQSDEMSGISDFSDEYDKQGYKKPVEICIDMRNNTPPSTSPREMLDEYDLQRLELEKQLEETEMAFEKHGLVGYYRDLTYQGQLKFDANQANKNFDEDQGGLHIESIEMDDDEEEQYQAFQPQLNVKLPSNQFALNVNNNLFQSSKK